MKQKIRSRIALVLAMSLVIGAIPGVSTYAKSKKSDKQVVKEEKSANKDQPIADGRYRIVTKLNDQMGLDLPGTSYSSGNNVKLYDITYEDCNFFDLKYDKDGYYEIKVPGTNLCVDHAGAEKKDGANCQIYTDNDTAAQRFKLQDAGDGYYFIVSKVDGRVLDVSGGNAVNNDNIFLYTRHGGENQKWKFVPEEKPVKEGQYRIISKWDTNMGLSLSGGSVTEGASVVVNSVSSGAAPLFEVKYDSKGFYRISVADTQYYLDEGDGGDKDGANLQIHADDKSSEYEKWRFVDAGDGYFYIRNGRDGRCIDLSAAPVADANVHLWTYHGGVNQRWALVEEVTPKLQDIAPFSLVGGLRIRWGSDLDLNNRLYKIDKTFPKLSGSSSSSSSMFGGLFGAAESADPAGIDIKYKENEAGAQWIDADLQTQTGGYVDLMDLTPGAEYVFKIRPYFRTMILGIPIGEKKYKQDWSEEMKRKTMEGNEGDIKTGDNSHAAIVNVAKNNGWYAGMHSQLLSGHENNLYAMVCKNKDFQIWIGYQYINSKLCYSWEISDYKLKKYKWIYRGTLSELKKDMATYKAGSKAPRLSTEYLKYKKGKEYTVKLVNISKKAKWSLPKPKNDRMVYGGVEIVKSTSDSVTIRFTKLTNEWGIYPYIKAKVGDDVYKCYIESGSHPTW